MEKLKKILRILIIALPWVIYALRIALTVIDLGIQSGVHKLLEKLKLNPPQKTPFE